MLPQPNTSLRIKIKKEKQTKIVSNMRREIYIEKLSKERTK